MSRTIALTGVRNESSDRSKRGRDVRTASSTNSGAANNKGVRVAKPQPEREPSQPGPLCFEREEQVRRRQRGADHVRGVPNRALLRTEEIHATERERQAEPNVAELAELTPPEAAQLFQREEQQRGRNSASHKKN